MERPTIAAGPRWRPRQRDRCIVLPHVDTVGTRFEGQVGPVVEHEGHAVGTAHLGGDAGRQGRPGLELLVAELDHVDAPRDAGGEEIGQIGPVRRAEVEAATGEVGSGGHSPAHARAFMAFLVARTFSRLAASVMSATDRRVPAPP